MISLTIQKSDVVLVHYGTPGMKKGIRRSHYIPHPRKPGFFAKRKAKKEAIRLEKEKQLARKMFDENREKQFINEYKNRDKMSTKQLKARINRIKAEQELKDLVEKPGKERAKAEAERLENKKKRQAKILSAALTVYGNAPIARGKNKDAIKRTQAWAKAFKDVPTTLAGGGK